MGRPKKYRNNWPSATELASFAYPFDKYYWAKYLFEKNKSAKRFNPFEECEQITAKAREIGHVVHDAIEQYTKTKTYPSLPPMEKRIFNEFKKIIDQEQLFNGLNEITGYSYKHGIGGTFDYLLNSVLYDWKTDSPKTSKKKYELQMAYYALIILEELGINIKKAVIYRVTKENPPQVYRIEIDITSKLKKKALCIRRAFKEITGR